MTKASSSRTKRRMMASVNGAPDLGFHKVLDDITDIIAMASQQWEQTHGPAKAGHMTMNLVANLAARYAITTNDPVLVQNDLQLTILTAMHQYAGHLEEKTGKSHTEVKAKLIELGAIVPQEGRPN